MLDETIEVAYATPALVDKTIHPDSESLEDVKSADGVAPSSPELSSDVARLEDAHDFPTEEERKTLPRIAGPIAYTSFLIAIIELAERFSYYGTVVVFSNFIRAPLPPGSTTGAGLDIGVSGALGLGQQAAQGLTTFNTFWVYICPLFGAYVADVHLGRYKTICYAVGIAIIGHVLLVISAIPSVIVNPNASVAVFAIAIIIMGVGTGAFKSNISPLIAEQSSQTYHVIVRADGKKYLQDPALTTARIFNYFYLFINIGALIGQIAMVYAEKQVGFYLAYLLPTIVFLLCPIILVVGRNRYVRTPPAHESLLLKAWSAFRYSARGRWTSYKALRAPDFWFKPSQIPVNERPSFMERYKTYDDQFVDEVRRGLKACAVFMFFPFYWITYNQLNNNLTSQAATMNTYGLPNDILNNLDPFALIILIPITDLYIYPLLRKHNINFTPVKRIFGGFIAGGLAMVWATVVQVYIYKGSECGSFAGDVGCAPVDINVWAQTGSYVLIAISEILASITGLEYAFTKAPPSMRSLVVSVFLFQNAFSAAIGEALVPLSGDPLLVWNYGAMAVLAFVAGGLFWYCFRDLDREEVALNELSMGRSLAIEPENHSEDKKNVV